MAVTPAAQLPPAKVPAVRPGTDSSAGPATLLCRSWFSGTINAASVAGGGGSQISTKGWYWRQNQVFLASRLKAAWLIQCLGMNLTALLCASFPMPKLKWWLDLGGDGAVSVISINLKRVCSASKRPPKGGLLPSAWVAKCSKMQEQ